MKIIRFRGTFGEVVRGEHLGDGRARPLDGELFGEPEPCGDAIVVESLLPPVQPTTIFGIGVHDREQATESGMEFPTNPIVFMKPVSSAIGSGERIVLPQGRRPDGEADYECELAGVTGTAVRDVPEDEPRDCVFGDTAAGDVPARDWRLNGGGGQWIRGKGFGSCCPLGAALVTADEFSDPQRLPVRTFLNGEFVQDQTTADMIFSVRCLISFLSEDTTLLPGTVSFAGTPQGVGFARKPPFWLTNGDEAAVEIDRIGRLDNPVVSNSSRELKGAGATPWIN